MLGAIPDGCSGIDNFSAQGRLGRLGSNSHIRGDILSNLALTHTLQVLFGLI